MNVIFARENEMKNIIPQYIVVGILVYLGINFDYNLIFSSKIFGFILFLIILGLLFATYKMTTKDTEDDKDENIDK